MFNVESRDGIEQTQTTLTDLPAATHDPLVVLVSDCCLAACVLVTMDAACTHDLLMVLVSGCGKNYQNYLHM